MSVKKPAPKAVATPEIKLSILGVYQGVIDEARAEVEAEIKGQLDDWKIELARIKEEDDYQFNKEKRDRVEALEAEIATRTAAVTEREQQVAAREASIGDAEKTIADLQLVVESIPHRESKAESAGFSKGHNEAKKDAAADLRITEAATNAKVEILNNRVQTLEATNASQNATIESLRTELKEANARVQEIATNAVNASGNSKVTVQNAPAGNGR